MNSKEFLRRRKQLMSMVGEEGIAILPAAPVRTRTRDVEHRYRQDSDFYYLTGFPEPEAVAVLVPGRAAGEFLLFCRERDREKERWDGSRMGPDGAAEHYGADDAFLTEWVKSLRSRISKGVHTPQEFIALDHLLHDMRLYKSRAEIAAMRRAAKIAVNAHTRAMRTVRPGMFEYEIEAEFIHEFRRNDAWASYNPIIGSGRNSCTLHYVDNRARLEGGDLLLIDAGCEVDYYASDVTRTMPVNGKYTPEQRAVYEIVLEAQLAAIEKVRRDNHWNDPHDAAVRVITKGLKKLGLLDGTLPKLIKDGAYREFYMHRTGHWLGMDVHDVGDYKVGDEWRLLEPGMAMTVEPGIYLPDSRKVPARFRSIGIRIEDDVVVTNNGADVLSKGLAKEPDAVEALMQG
jgi:Xaa-Pro aminopeptidase